MIRFTLLTLFIGFSFSNALAQTPDTVFLEELTWTEVREAIDSGTTTVLSSWPVEHPSTATAVSRPAPIADAYLMNNLPA